MAPARTRRATAAVLAGALTLTAAAAHADETVVQGGTTGSRGIGDPYFPNYGNGGYDVRLYDIEVRFDPRTEELQGTTTIQMVPTQDLTRFNLDLVLDARSVEVDGVPAAFEQTWHELVITPGSRLERGEPALVEVTYGGIPSREPRGGRSYWITTRDGAIALGEPEIAAWWFPSNDHPTDKARFNVSITVPTGKEAISNGELLFQSTEPPYDWTTWHWQLRSRAATYLMFLAIGNYDIEQGRANGHPYLHAFGTNIGRAAKRSIRFTDEAVEFLESRWGPYPYTTIGGVVPNGDFKIGFALETQTRPVYDNAFFSDVNRSVVIHEMAHQWFGDSLAVERWKHIWLNEGFATYSEWVFAASQGGRTAQQQFLDLYTSIPAADRFWDLEIGDPGPRNLFDIPVYDRGAMTLQALRNRVGNADFFQIMREWASEFAGENVRTSQFESLAEDISNEQLDSFFDAWLFTGEKPARTADNGF